jgi:hypothetical protein
VLLCQVLLPKQATDPLHVRVLWRPLSINPSKWPVPIKEKE